MVDGCPFWGNDIYAECEYKGLGNSVSEGATLYELRHEQAGLWNFYCCIYLQDLGGNFTWRFLIEKPLWTPPYVSH